MNSRKASVLILVAIGFYSLPIWITERLPGQEIPQHLLMVELSRRIADHQEFFALAWKLVPGSLFYWFARVLGSAVPVLITAKISLTAYVAGMILAFIYLTRIIHGRKGTPVFYGLLTIYGWFFYKGDLSFLLGIPLLLFAIGILLSLLGSEKSPGKLRVIVSLSVLGSMIYLSDLSLFILFLIASILGDILHRQEKGAFAGPLFLGIVLSVFIGFFVLSTRNAQYMEGLDFDFLRSDGLGLPMLIRWPSFNANLVFIYQSLALWKNMGGFLLLAAPIGYYMAFFFRKSMGSLNTGEKTFIFNNYKTLFVALLTVISFLLFWVFPSLLPYPGYKGLNWVYLSLIACFIIVLRCPARPPWHEKFLCLSLIPLLNLLMVINVSRTVDVKTRPVLQVVDSIPPGQKVLFLNFKNNDTPLFQNPYRFIFSEYHIDKGGYSPYTFAWYLASPVAYKKSFLRSPPLSRPGEFKKLVHRFGYDYIVLLGSETEIPRRILSEASSAPWKPKSFPAGVVIKAP